METHEGEHDSLFLASISSEHNKNFILVKETPHPVFFKPLKKDEWLPISKIKEESSINLALMSPGPQNLSPPTTHL